MSADPHAVLARESLTRWRWRARLPRLALLSTCGLLSALGLRALLTGPPPAAPSSTSSRRAVSVPAGLDGIAEAFARAYLSFDSARPQARARALRPLLGSDVPEDAGAAAPVSGARRITWTSALARADLGGGRWLVTVAAADSDGVLEYLAVPVARARDGAPTVDAPPAVVGAPAPGRPAAPTGEDVEDPGLARVVERALGNWLRGDATDLAADLAPGVRLPVPARPVSLERVERLEWAGPGRVAVTVGVQDADRVLRVLRYELAVTRRERWYVRGLPAPSSEGVP